MIMPQFLMSLLCVDDCTSVLGAIPDNYHDICLGDVLRKWGFKQFIWVACDYQFTDILDAAEWQTARDNGKVGISPEGTLSFNAPTQDTFVIDGCGREKGSEAVIAIDYTTYQTKEDLSDYTYWKTIYRNSSAYKIIVVDCNGIFWLADSYIEALALGAPVTVLGESPGLDFSMTGIPNPQPGANPVYQVWSMQVQLKLTDVVCAGFLPGVLDALASTPASS